MTWRIGRIPFPVVLAVVAALTIGLFLVGYRWDSDPGGLLLMLIPIVFAGAYLWDAARVDRENELARAAAAASQPPAAPPPSSTSSAASPTRAPAAPPVPPDDDEPFDDPVEEADRIESETRSRPEGGDAP